MKLIAILTLVAVFLSGATFSTVIGFGEIILDVGGLMLNQVNDVIGIPDAQRYDILSIPPYERVTHPILNPDDTMSVADFLYMRHKDAVRSNLDVESNYKDDMYGDNNYDVVDRYLYFIKGSAVGTLDTDLQGYSSGTKVMFNYKIPCVRYLYNGDIYFMLDPLTTSWLPGFEVASPFSVQLGAIPFSGLNQLREKGYLSNDVIVGSPTGEIKSSDVNYGNYNTIIEQTQYELVDYLNDEIIIDRMNVEIIAPYFDGMSYWNDIDYLLRR